MEIVLTDGLRLGKRTRVALRQSRYSLEGLPQFVRSVHRKACPFEAHWIAGHNAISSYVKGGFMQDRILKIRQSRGQCRFEDGAVDRSDFKKLHEITNLLSSRFSAKRFLHEVVDGRDRGGTEVPRHGAAFNVGKEMSPDGGKRFTIQKDVEHDVRIKQHAYRYLCSR